MRSARSSLVVVLSMFLAFVVPCRTHAQVGNLGWVGGDQPAKRGGETDWSEGRLQLRFTPSYSVVKTTIPANYYYFSSAAEWTDHSLHPLFGFAYRAVESSSSNARWDLTVVADVDPAIMLGQGIDFRYRLAAAVLAGPEVGIRLPMSGGMLVRPFASITPGYSLKEPGYRTKDRHFLWAARIGMEVGGSTNRVSGDVGVRYIHHGNIDDGSSIATDVNGNPIGSQDRKVKETMLYLGLRYKI